MSSVSSTYEGCVTAAASRPQRQRRRPAWGSRTTLAFWKLRKPSPSSHTDTSEPTGAPTAVPYVFCACEPSPSSLTLSETPVKLRGWAYTLSLRWVGMNCCPFNARKSARSPRSSGTSGQTIDELSTRSAGTSELELEIDPQRQRAKALPASGSTSKPAPKMVTGVPPSSTPPVGSSAAANVSSAGDS